MQRLRNNILPALLALLMLWVLPAHAKPLNIQQVTSPGGIKAWLVEDHSIPIIALDFAFKGAGSKNDTAEKQGLARMLSNTLDEGAGELDATAFQKELLDRSITLAFSAGRDDFGGELKSLTRHSPRAFELLKLALTQPRFDEDAVTRMRDANMARVRTSLAEPEWIAARLQNDIVYKGHPYALNSGGTLSTLPGITPDDLRTYTKAHLSRDRLLIGVAGDITPADLGKKLDEVFGTLPAKASAPALETPVTLHGAGEIYVYEKDIPQSVVEMIAPGIAHTDPAWHHAEILNFVLGGSGFGSHLMEEIREKRGLTYGIYSGLSSMDHGATLSIGTSTKNESTAEMLSLIGAEVDKLKTNGLTAQELKDAQSYLIGSVPLSLTSTDRISGFLLSAQVRGYGMDYLEKREATIQSATLADVKAVGDRLLNPKAFTTIIVGSPQNLEPVKTITTIPNAE